MDKGKIKLSSQKASADRQKNNSGRQRVEEVRGRRQPREVR
jgi:hypothetical protein